MAEPLSGESAVTPGSCPGNRATSPSECLKPRNTGNPGASESSETESPHRHSPERLPILGYLLALAAAVIWGTLGIFASLIYRYEIDPVVLVTARGVIASSVLLVILSLTDRASLRIDIKDMPFFILFGFVGVTLNYLSYFEAIARTSATTAVILLYTASIFVTVAASLLFKERFTLSKGLSLAITLLGCFLVAGGYNPGRLVANPMGVVAGIVAAVTYGCYTLFSKHSLAKCKSSTTVLYALVFGSLFLSLISAPRLNQLWGLPGLAWGLVVALALGPTLGAYALYIKALSHIEASHTSIVCMAEPAATAVLAYAILSERMETMQVVGAIAVIAGVLVLQLGPKAFAKPPPARRGVA